jgi:hypothetical protein
MANQPTPQSPKEHLQQMNILYMALLGGQLIIVTLLYFLQEGPVNEDESAMLTSGGIDPIVLIGCMLFIASVSASFFMYNKKKVEGAQLSGTLMEKLDHYRVSFIMRAALLEGPNLTMIVLYFFVNQHIIFMAMLAIGLTLFSIIRPTVDRIAQDYDLSGSEQNELRNSMN